MKNIIYLVLIVLLIGGCIKDYVSFVKPNLEYELPSKPPNCEIEFPKKIPKNATEITKIYIYPKLIHFPLVKYEDMDRKQAEAEARPLLCEYGADGAVIHKHNPNHLNWTGDVYIYEGE